MRFSGKRGAALCFMILAAMLFELVLTENVFAEGEKAEAEGGPAVQRVADQPDDAGQAWKGQAVAAITYQNYSGLAELITRVCDEAAEQFYGFYGPTWVDVKPFVAVSDSGEKKMTLLGVTLADQMIAMINNDPTITQKTSGDYQQDLKGVLQEVDGYLRIHISGFNSHAVRRSYVVTVEMAESIYRLLHTYVDVEG